MVVVSLGIEGVGGEVGGGRRGVEGGWGREEDGAYGLLGSTSEQYHVWERDRAKEGRLREALVEML